MYKITEEEIKRILLDSPSSLPSSPSEAGMKAPQTKAFFYKFINTLIKILNEHYDSIEKNTSEELNKAIISLEKGLLIAIEETVTDHDEDDSAHIFLNLLISELKDGLSKTDSKINEHSISGEAHSDIRSSIGDSIIQHNTDASSHSDIREGIKGAEEKANNAYNLASGKSKVMPFAKPLDFFEYLDGGNTVNVGDMFIFESANEPDLTYFGAVDSSDGLIIFDYDGYKNGYVALKPGIAYYHNGHKLVSSESGIDTTVFAKTEELSEVSYMLGNGINDLGTRVSDLEASSLTHEKKKTYTTSTSTGIITLKTYGVTDLGEVSALTLKLPSSVLKDYNSVLNFKSGATATTLTYTGIYFKGDSCVDGVFTPEANKLYEVYIKRPSSTVVAHVSAIDYVAEE